MTRRAAPSRSELSKAATRTQAAATKRDAGAWQHPELEHVPTVLELAARGLARPVDGSAYRLEPEGQELIYAAMRRNAERLKADPELQQRVTLAAITRGRTS